MRFGNATWKLAMMLLVGLASGSALAGHGSFGGHFGGHSGGHFSFPMGGHFVGHSGGHFGGHFDGHFGHHFDGHFHHHHDGHFRVFLSAPLFWGWGWDYPAYYSSPSVVVESSPPVYIEQDSGAAADAEGGAYWYYCPETQSYYPYVKTCPGGWQRVMPEPPPS